MSNPGDKSPKTKRWGIILAIEIILILVLVPVIVLYAKLSSVQSATKSDVNKEDILINDIDTTVLEGYDNIILYGLDTREGELKGGDTRSDSIILLSIDHDDKMIKILSIYRDTCVKVPGYGLTKLNHAYAYGGPQLSMSTINTNFDLNVTEFAAVDFGILAKIIDAVGGIELEITEPEFNLINPLIDEQNGVTDSDSEHLDGPGYQHVNGTQATAYARIRKSDSDFKRAERQRIVLGKVFEKMKSSNLSVLMNVIDTVLPEVYTNLSSRELVSLARNLTSYNIADSQGFPFKVITGTLYTDRLSYDFADGFNDNVTMLHNYLYGTEAYTPSLTAQQIGDEIYASRVR